MSFGIGLIWGHVQPLVTMLTMGDRVGGGCADFFYALYFFFSSLFLEGGGGGSG